MTIHCLIYLHILSFNFSQALQEDEDENIEEGARIATELLGKEKNTYIQKYSKSLWLGTIYCLIYLHI